MRISAAFLLSCVLSTLPAAAIAGNDRGDRDRRWLAGDHHVHSEWSVDWDRSTTPPTPVRGGDSPYSRSRNARQALAHGLAWMVHTDHGGPGHSAATRDHAWPALQQARREVPELVQFNGMEFDVPGAEHATVIVAPGPRERDELVAIERDYGRSEPVHGSRDDGQAMLDALAHMRALPAPPLVIVNHPSRTAAGIGAWGEVDPAELRAWHDAAPEVLVGMEGAPGHQATASDRRGFYRNPAAPTFGGFDQMTAQVGGVWDALLAEGRRFWITTSSDSHINRRDGGHDFDPGEYSKTWVWARPEAGDILDGLRHGRMFATTGDLVDALEFHVQAAEDPARHAGMGGTLVARPGETLRVRLRLRQPGRPNFNGQSPRLDHVDLIVGEPGEAGPRMQVQRIESGQWQREGEWIAIERNLPAPPAGGFVRVRGSSNAEATPQPDTPGEDPWQDLWFYSNPVFVEVRPR